MTKRILLLLIFILPLMGMGQNRMRIAFLSQFKPADERTEYFKEHLLAETQKTLGKSVEIVFDHYEIGDLPLKELHKKYQQICRKHDLVLIAGDKIGEKLTTFKKFNKPTIVLGVFDPERQNLPLTKEGTSGIKNLNYILFSYNVEKELSLFKSHVDFKHVAFVVSEIEPFYSETSDYYKFLEKKYNIKITRVVAKANEIISINQIPEDADAVFIATPFDLISDQISLLSKELIKKKIPSYSMSGRDVDAGILMSLKDDGEIDQLFRKLAITIDDVWSRHGNLEDVSVYLRSNEKLTVNIATGRAIDFRPSFKLIFSAQLVGREQMDTGKKYTLEQLVIKGLEQNLDIQVSKLTAALTEQDWKDAIANYLPDLSLSAKGVLIDKKRASDVTGTAEFTGSGSVVLTQVIYSEEVIAGIKIQQFLAQADQFAAEVQINSTILDISQAYLQILKAKANRRIQLENLEKLIVNLELAQSSFDLGGKNRSDVNRWEIEVATAKQTLIEANADLEVAKLQLNSYLNNVLERDYDIDENFKDNALLTRYEDSELGKLIHGPYELSILEKALVKYALVNHPAKKQLVFNEKAIDRQLKMNRRKLYSPTISLQGNYDPVLMRAGKGKEIQTSSDPSGMMSSMFQQNNHPWNVAVNISYPLFNQRKRSISLTKSKIQKEQVGDQLRKLDNDLTLGVQVNLYRVMTASTNIRNTQISAEKAVENFNLVQDNYKQGRVNIIQLLDAQKAALDSRLANAISQYDYLNAFLVLENAVGDYQILNNSSLNRELLQIFESIKDDE